MRRTLDFWFSIGSTYTCLTVLRIGELVAAADIDVRWRPFNVRAIMQEMNNIPFVGKPAKAAYMWRDIERRAAKLGIDIAVPVEYPLKNFELVNRLAILAAETGHCAEFARAFYSDWFGNPRAGSEPAVARIAQAAGMDEDDMLATAESADAQRKLEAATDEARRLGIFGSPSFVVAGRELFWGDDRLEDAIDWLSS